MSRYIDAVRKAEIIGTFMDTIRDISDEKETIKELHKVYEKLNALPTADVREDVHGEWISKETFFDDLNVFVCSNCKMRFATRDSRSWNYCPKCGARMDGEE